MRYFASCVSSDAISEFTWSDFVFTRNRVDVGSHYNLMKFTRSVSGYIREDFAGHFGGRYGDWSEECAMNIAYFMSFSSKYADYQDWTKVRSWFKAQAPADQNLLVKARQWFQGNVRKFLSDDCEKPFGAFVAISLNTGAVRVAMHIDHSDC